MTKKLIAPVLAATLAMTSISATPAFAKPNDGVRILQGLAALYIISRVVKDSHTPKVAPVVPAERPTVRRPRDRRLAWDVPRRCLKTYYTNRGERRAIGARCVRRNAPNVVLPRQCERRLSTDRGRRVVFSRRCVREHGFQISRR